MKNVDYVNIFRKVEESIKNNLFVTPEEFEKKAERFKNIDFRSKNVDEIFWVLTCVVFYSGIRANMIEQKLAKIEKNLYGLKRLMNLSDDGKLSIKKDVGFPRKCDYCFENANEFSDLMNKFGSFTRYVESFGISDLEPDESKLNLLREDLKRRFKGLGPRTVNHFLADLGFKNVLKPDRVICRIFHRLGLIDSDKDINGAIREGRNFAAATGNPIRYIDIIFVKYGQIGKSDVLGTRDGICLEREPKCSKCGVTCFCNYFKEKNRDVWRRAGNRGGNLGAREGDD